MVYLDGQGDLVHYEMRHVVTPVVDQPKGDFELQLYTILSIHQRRLCQKH
jgi:hypothetical protein